MSTENITQEILAEIENKLQRYRDTHNGKSPARIFVPYRRYIILSMYSVIRFDELLPIAPKMSGIPVVIFDYIGKESEIYLSEEEE